MTHQPIHPVRRDPSFGGVFSRTFLLALMAGLLLWLVWRDLARSALHDPFAEPRTVEARGDLAQDEKATIELFEASSPAVVYVDTLRRAVQRDFFHTNSLEIPEGSGSGFVWDDQGHVVTNNHVVADGDDFEVRLKNQHVYRARLVGKSEEHDLAVLKIDAQAGELVPLPVGASGDLLVGQKVFAIGNPFGLDQTLTTGVISGLEREITSVKNTPIRGVIQTDAAINPGNSGGPLLDSSGRLIGINTAIQSPSGAYAGVGFAVPVDTINRIVPMLIRKGYAPRAGLGVTLAPDTAVRQLGWKGALLWQVATGGAADRAGLVGTTSDEGRELRYGDLVIGVDGQPVRSSGDLQAILLEHDPGDRIELDLIRDPAGKGSEHKVEVRLQEL